MINIKPPGKGHGGKRIGAGRPMNPAAPLLEQNLIDAVAASGKTAAEMAKAFEAVAIASLVNVAQSGLNEPARVQASRALVAIAKDSPTVPEHDPSRPASEAEQWENLLN